MVDGALEMKRSPVLRSFRVAGILLSLALQPLSRKKEIIHPKRAGCRVLDTERTGKERVGVQSVLVRLAAARACNGVVLR